MARISGNCLVGPRSRFRKQAKWAQWIILPENINYLQKKAFFLSETQRENHRYFLIAKNSMLQIVDIQTFRF